jgi:hypothetical protein
VATDIFDALDEVACVLDPGTWMLVGGLMVHAHSVQAGVSNQRLTDDADIVLEVGVTHYADAARHLHSIGFEPHNSPTLANRRTGSTGDQNTST